MTAHYEIRKAFATFLLVVAPPILIARLIISGVPQAEWLVGLLAVATVLTAYGYNVGSHYTFTHRIFKFSRPVELFLIYTGVLSACASPISWAVHHNAHHRYAETRHDPHSPVRLGWRAAFAVYYRTDKADPMLIRHLLRDPAQRFADSDFGFWAIIISWPLFVWLLAGRDGLLFLWLAPVWYVLAVSVAFVLCHTGRHDERSQSRAVNSKTLSVLSLGDGNHLDHHRNMRTCGRGPRLFAKLLGA